jgi:tetratricopeptide (TPR) repeat protein
VLLGSEGDEAGALLRYQAILSLDERDTVALAALERDAERRGDWDALAELLRRRSRLPQSVDDQRRIRLYLAQMLEARLGRPEDARAELETLLVETGDNLLALTTLADLNERLGGKLRAAPLWLRASAFPKDPVEAAELSRRACQAYLDGGDVESARRVFADMKDYPRTAKLIALHVDIARRGESPEALSEALEALALSSMEPPKVRAGLLVEAARAALANRPKPRSSLASSNTASGAPGAAKKRSRPSRSFAPSATRSSPLSASCKHFSWQRRSTWRSGRGRGSAS